MKLDRRSALGLVVAAPLLGVAAPAFASVPPRGEGYRYMIMPDILRVEAQSKTQHDNCWTIHYQWMCRGTEQSGWLLPEAIAHVDSRMYHQWLREGDYFTTDARIPPHIQFGGAVVSGERDPTFHQRWADFAADKFGHWVGA